MRKKIETLFKRHLTVTIFYEALFNCDDILARTLILSNFYETDSREEI